MTGALCLRGAGLLMTAEGPKDDPLGMIESAAIVAIGERVAWVGRERDLPGELLRDAEVRDVEGRLVTPGLIDCHAHPVFAGNRAGEYAMRAAGHFGKLVIEM